MREGARDEEREEAGMAVLRRRKLAAGMIIADRPGVANGDHTPFRVRPPAAVQRDAASRRKNAV